MRLKAAVVAAVLAAGTTLIYVGPASAQQADGPNCDDFPTQIDIANSIFPPDLDPTDLDANDDGVGCEANPGPPVPYDLTVFPPVGIEPEPEPNRSPSPNRSLSLSPRPHPHLSTRPRRHSPSRRNPTSLANSRVAQSAPRLRAGGRCAGRSLVLPGVGFSP